MLDPLIVTITIVQTHPHQLWLWIVTPIPNLVLMAVPENVAYRNNKFATFASNGSIEDMRRFTTPVNPGILPL